MKLNHIVLAAVALCGASQAFAATQYLAGSSAASVNVMKATQNLCADAGGTFKLFTTSTKTSSLGNVFTGVCSTDITGAAYNTVAMNVSGGSMGAVTATTTPVAYLAPVQASCTAVTGTENLAAFSNLYSCPSSQATGTHLADGGFMDVEGPVFNASLDPSAFTPAGFSQVFGVGVNATLYNALQTAQFGAAASCTTNTSIKYTAACQPSISKAQIASLINSDVSNAGKTKGGQFLVGGTTDTTKITYCMRPQSSGTQQSAQLYFLSYAANGANGGAETIIPEGVSKAKYASVVNSGTSDVKNCLDDNTGYKFGMLSLENNPLAGSDTYRFVKLSGVAGAQGASSTDSNTATALTGEYDYVFETVAYCKVGGDAGVCPEVVQSILDNVDISLPVGSSTAGLFLTGVESVFSRGGNAGSPYIAR